jgi:NifB/MoaA-like Fe-S oxidoreductase
MPRLKNELNIKDRKTHVVQTSGSVVYKTPLGEEEPKIGHFISQEIIDRVLVIRFATKKETDEPVLRVEHFEEAFEVKFN